MKITRRQLRTILRESLQEGSFSDMDIEAMEQGTGRYAGGPESDTKWGEGGWGSEGYELGYSQGLNGMAFEDEWKGDADYEAGYEKGYDEYRTEFAKSMLEPAWSPERDREEWGDLDEGGFSDMDIEAMEQGTGRYADPDYPAPTGTELEPEFFRDMQTAEDAAVNMVFGDGSERLGDTLPWEVRIVSVDGEYSLYAMKDGFDRYDGEGKEVAALSRGGAIRYGRRIG